MIYNDFRDCENATIVIESIGEATLDPVTYQPVYGSPVVVFDGRGIFYEISASEQVARQQIQKGATGQIILDPLLVTIKIEETQKVYITTKDIANKEYRMVTVKNPLDRDEAIIIDLVEA
jgi:hypothetical protein